MKKDKIDMTQFFAIIELAIVAAGVTLAAAVTLLIWWGVFRVIFYLISLIGI